MKYRDFIIFILCMYVYCILWCLLCSIQANCKANLLNMILQFVSATWSCVQAASGWRAAREVLSPLWCGTSSLHANHWQVRSSLHVAIIINYQIGQFPVSIWFKSWRYISFSVYHNNYEYMPPHCHGLWLSLTHVKIQDVKPFFPFFIVWFIPEIL